MTKAHRIDMLTRVEGHGAVQLVSEGKQVVAARFELRESPRLFEALLVGRPFEEIADTACRICSICSTVHKVAALQAVEQAVGIKVSTQTGLLRELAVQGGQIESHALHIFCLSLPDYLGVGGFQGLAAREPDKLKLGLKLKKLGNLIQELVGGRAIHPFNLLVGGLGTVPDREQLTSLRAQLAQSCDGVAASSAYIFALADILPPLPMLPACAVSGGPQLFGSRLSTSTAQTINAADAVAWLNERVAGHSYAKVSHFGHSGPYMVGPLARLTLAMPPAFAADFADATIRSAQKARIIELQQALERADALIDLLLANGLQKESPVKTQGLMGEGTALLEAPRGVLLHNYRFNEQGTCTAANVITPTAINQGAMAVALQALITTMAGATYEEVKAAAERLIRCFDPCISCAVH